MKDMLIIINLMMIVIKYSKTVNKYLSYKLISTLF